MFNFITSVVINYSELAIFICHLFIDGHFRTGHILFNPKIFDGHLLNEIDMICPQTIPWISTDITENVAFPWNSPSSTDHILQLIFDETKYSTGHAVDQDWHTIYHIFVCLLNDSDDWKKSIPVWKSSKIDSTIVYFSLKSNSISL